MLGLSVIILFNLIFNVNSNLAESSANCSGLFIVTNHYNCLFRTCRINAGCKTSPILLFLRGNGGWVPMGLLGPQNCSPTHTTVISGHRWLQMAGSPWISVGSGWDTSRIVCWCHLDPPKLPCGGSEIAPKCHETVISGHRWLLYTNVPYLNVNQ